MSPDPEFTTSEFVTGISLGRLRAVSVSGMAVHLVIDGVPDDTENVMRGFKVTCSFALSSFASLPDTAIIKLAVDTAD